MTRKECSVLRGIAILFIVLHNFCKRVPFAIPENEYSFNLENALLFWKTMQWDTVFIQFFSFWGHLGVPVFVLLSGYGLVLKYDSITPLDWKSFLWKHYKKLCYPMVGGLFAFYIVRYVMNPFGYNDLLEIFPLKQFLALLTMTINLMPEPHKLILPGPYWYFGMTMQLYVVYLLAVHKRPTTYIIILAVATLLASLFLEPYPPILIWIKINAIGWLLPFAYGIMLGRMNCEGSSRHAVILTLCILVAIPLMSLTYYTWLLVPLLVAVLAVNMVSLIPKFLVVPLDFVGRISLYVFVIHPIVREFTFLYHMNPYLGILLYVTITLVVSYIVERTMKKGIIYTSILTLLFIVVYIVAKSFIHIQLPHGAVLHVLPAQKDHQAHGAVIICPGGGYSYLEKKKEGYWWFPFLYKQGYTVALLEYRMPNHDWQIPMTDGAEAVRTMREHAKEWHFDANNVGIMGFSAGGHLASTLMVSDNASVRPDFGILYYPVISMKKELTHKDSHHQLLGKDASEQLELRFSNELHVSEKTPPTYIAVSSDDKGVNTQNSIRFHNNMLKKKRPVTLHVYPSGGHGWGYRWSFEYHDQMLEDLAEWLSNR